MLQTERTDIENYHDQIIDMSITMTTKEIADELNMNFFRVQLYCNDHSIKTISDASINDFDERIRELAHTKTTTEIAEIIGYSYRYVYKYCRDNKIQMFRKKTLHDYKDRIIEMAKTMTITEIAKELDFSTPYISSYLKEIGVQSKGVYRLSSRQNSWELLDIEINEDTLVGDYHQWWCFVYKESSIRAVTFEKYRNTNAHLRYQLPDTKLKDVTRSVYQGFMNRLGEHLTKQSVMDINNNVKRSLQDAAYENLLERDPTYGLKMSGLEAKRTHKKFISENELDILLNHLDYGTDLNNNYTKSSWLIFLGAKTGFRLGEILGLTVDNFNFENNEITVDKSLDYKGGKPKFQPTKNKSSMRTITVDNVTMTLFKNLIQNVTEGTPIFAQDGKRIHNSTFNKYLEKKCKEAGISRITVHSLRHTHASILLANDVSMQTVSKRLGHSDLTTTQNVYSHITDELARKDDDKINLALSKLGGF